MAAIRILPERIVNRIAAGEVIERPAAAVKELVENALDAGATRVAIALDGGGIDRIEVSDDGGGMDAAGLALAVQRHATSKLADEDLVRIATLGFRGEALPSIGAAARLAITSRPPDADAAFAISVEGGAVSAVTPAAGAPGTRVVVRDLFFATPARRKFLKHPRTEADHAEAAVRRLALSAPDVAFRLESDGRTLFDLPRQDRAARVASLLGPDAAAALLQVVGERGPLKLEGFIASPAVTRATAASQGLTVNGRPVADPVLKTAVRVAYRDVIAAGRHPVVALYLALPAEELDVNVHPSKAELRFRDPGAVRALVIGTLGRALGGGAGTEVPAPRPALHLVHSRPSSALPHPAPLPGFAHSGVRNPGFADAQLPLGAAPAARFWPAPAALPEHPLGAPVAQVLDTYVIAVASDGSLVLVDQHAAHERLTHEALRAEMLEGGVRTQALLLPAVVELPPSDAARLLARSAELARLGLEIESFGGGAVLVRALPAALGAPDPAPLLRDLADRAGRAAGCGDRATGLPRLDPRRAAADARRDGRAAATDGGDAASRDLQPWPPDLPETDTGGYRETVRPPLNHSP
jgi:DNA mismatch repair protein MutL